MSSNPLYSTFEFQTTFSKGIYAITNGKGIYAITYQIADSGRVSLIKYKKEVILILIVYVSCTVTTHTP